MKKPLLILIMTLVPLMTFADGTEINGIYYNLVSKTKQAEVTSNPNKYSGSINIPSTVEYDGITYDVTKLGYRAFHSCEDVTSVSIPNSITTIEEGVFSWCYGLTELDIPNSVTSLGKKAISQCRNIASITIGTGLNSIDREAFAGCVGIKKVIIKDIAAWCQIDFGDNPLEWGNGKIYNDENTEITELVIPDGVTIISGTAFRGCSSLTSVVLPNTIEKIYYDAFASCTGLTSIEIPNSVTFLSGFSSCTGLTSVTIPNSVTTIGSSAFYGCTGLTSIEIPNSVTTIQNGAFSCSNLKKITIPNSVVTIDNNAFYGCNKLTEITIGSGVQTIGDRTFENCQEISDVYCYPEQVPQTNATAFDNSLIEYATLHVPEAAINSYKTTAPWSGFKEVVAISPSGITKLEASETSVKCEDGQLTVEGINDGQMVEVYSLNGEKRGSAVSKNGVARIDTNVHTGSVVVVKMGEKSVKVIVK